MSKFTDSNRLLIALWATAGVLALVSFGLGIAAGYEADSIAETQNNIFAVPLWTAFGLTFATGILALYLTLSRRLSDKEMIIVPLLMILAGAISCIFNPPSAILVILGGVVLLIVATLKKLLRKARTRPITGHPLQ